MVYVDSMLSCVRNQNWHWDESCHLMADSVDELVRFAESIGCQKGWLQRSRGGLAHFDLTRRMRERAVAAGAKEIGRQEMVSLMRRKPE